LNSLVLEDENRRQVEQVDNVSANLVLKLDNRKPGLKHEVFDSIVSQNIGMEDMGNVDLITGREIE